MPTEREIFTAAIERDKPTDRQAFLDSACGTDSELRRRIELLVTAHEADDNFMARAPVASDDARLDSPTTRTLAMTNDSSVSVAGGTGPLTGYRWRLARGTQFGRYVIEKELGRGGMATVYLALDERLKRRVALKIPHFDPHEEPDLAARFQREAHTMASVVHRNLCVIHDVDEHAGLHYLSMAYLDGHTLTQVLHRGEQIPSQRVAELMRKLAQATQRAHQAGVVHRDLKPGNVMIDLEGEPVIMDFGLAFGPTTDARLTQSGLIMGTPAYMSPEQAQGDPRLVGPASDIYSLGAIMYELLTGRPVYTGSISLVLGQLVSNQPAAAPRSIRPEIDPTLEAICLKALARLPEDRYASASEFAAALHEFLTSESVVADVGRAVVQVPKATSAKRAPTWQRVTASLVILLVMAAIVILVQTPHGTLVAEIADDAIATQVQGRKLTIRDTQSQRTYELTLTGRESTQSLPAGGYRIEVTEPDSGLTLSAYTFQITRADRHPAVTVRFEPPPATEPSALTLSPVVSAFTNWSQPEELGPGVNTAEKEENASITEDGLTLVFNRNVNVHPHLWESHRSSVTEPFAPATPLPEIVNLPGYSHDCPFLSPDELSLWFSSNRPGGYGQHDLWVSRRSSISESWGEPTNLGPQVNTLKFEQSPYISSDELTLLFSVDQPQGVFRILQTTRATRDEPFGEPKPLANINSGVCSSFPRLTSDGLAMIFVHCPRQGEPLKLYSAARATLGDDFGPPVELDSNINAFPASGPSLSGDGQRLYFSRQREGRFDLWSATRAP